MLDVVVHIGGEFVFDAVFVPGWCEGVVNVHDESEGNGVENGVNGGGRDQDKVDVKDEDADPEVLVAPRVELEQPAPPMVVEVHDVADSRVEITARQVMSFDDKGKERRGDDHDHDDRDEYIPLV